MCSNSRVILPFQDLLCICLRWGKIIYNITSTLIWACHIIYQENSQPKWNIHNMFHLGSVVENLKILNSVIFDYLQKKVLLTSISCVYISKCFFLQGHKKFITVCTKSSSRKILFLKSHPNKSYYPVMYKHVVYQDSEWINNKNHIISSQK